jgi:hypothetical protein
MAGNCQCSPPRSPRSALLISANFAGLYDIVTGRIIRLDIKMAQVEWDPSSIWSADLEVCLPELDLFLAPRC